MIDFSDGYSEHSKMQTSAKTPRFRKLRSRTKEPQQIPLPAGRPRTAMGRAPDGAALGQGGAQFSLWASVPGHGAEW